MDYKALNSKTRHVYTIRHSTKPVYTNRPDDAGYNEQVYTWEEVYDIGLDDGLFIKFYLETDSYGDNESITGFEFVKGKPKTITVYEF